MGGMLAVEVAALDIHRAKNSCSRRRFYSGSTPIRSRTSSRRSSTRSRRCCSTIPSRRARSCMTAIPTDFKALETMYVERVKRFATASKFLWPIPDRGLKKRAYRIAAPTLLLWGESDRLIPPIYAKEFTSRIKNSTLSCRAAGTPCCACPQRARTKIS